MFDKNRNFNFWPSFTDLMLILVLILFIILGVYYFELEKNKSEIATLKKNQTIANESSEDTGLKDNNSGENNKMIGKNISVEDLEERQRIMVTGLEDFLKDNSNINFDLEELDNGETITDFKEAGSESDNYYIRIRGYADRQKLMFSDKILFNSGKSEIKKEGVDLLSIVGEIIVNRLHNELKEIQIQGNADTVGNANSNLQLAYDRAAQVYNFFYEKMKIDPSEVLMSATSYGEYNSVQRSENPNSEYNQKKIDEDNSTTADKDLNRRIEVVLFYKIKQ